MMDGRYGGRKRGNMKKRLWSFGVIVGMTVSLLAGCGGAQAKPDAVSQEAAVPESAGDQAVSDAADSGEQVTIRFMDNMASEVRDKAYAEIIAKFEEANPNIKIEYETVPWDQSHSKLVTLGSTGTMPDVVQVHPTWIAEFVNAGWIVGLDSYLETYEYKDGFTDYTKNVLFDQTQRQVYGDVYVIPDAILTNGIFIRTDWAQEAGISYDDWTWNDFLDAAQKMTDKEKNQYGISFRGGRAAYHQAMFFLYSQTGGRVYDDEGNCVFNSPECVDIFTKYIDLYKNSNTPEDAINWGFAEMCSAFTSGLTGMLNQTCEVIEMCEQTLQDDQWTVATLPKSDVDGKIYNEISFSNGYAVAENSEHKEAAWKFIEYLSSPEAASIYCKTNLLIPVMKETLEDEFFTTGKMAGYAEMFKKDNLVAWPELGYFAEVGEFRETFADAEVQKCMQGQQTPQETLDKLAEFLTKYQQEYMAENPDVEIPMPKDTNALNN